MNVNKKNILLIIQKRCVRKIVEKPQIYIILMGNAFLIVHLVVIIYMIPLNVKLSAPMGTIPQNQRAHAMKVVLILP